APSLAHWRVTWIATPNGHGVTEGGSSGSPVFDSGGHIVGTLTGGDSSCDSLNSPDYYGRFSYHWDKNGTDSTKILKYWLDPDNTNTMILNGATLSVGEEPSPAAIRVAPNPFTDEVSVQMPGIKGRITLVVSDLTGHELIRRDFISDGAAPLNLRLGNLTPGLYFLRLAGDKFSSGVKLIRQR
ncbi:MAG: T9SS type A sorting domain-containing protein, partial [bacterium]